MTTQRLELELELGTDPICGSLHPEHGEPRRFCGWLELASALEASARDRPAHVLPNGANELRLFLRQGNDLGIGRDVPSRVSSW